MFKYFLLTLFLININPSNAANFSSNEEKDKLWQNLEMTYAQTNKVHEGFASLNLWDYFDWRPGVRSLVQCIQEQCLDPRENFAHSLSNLVGLDVAFKAALEANGIDSFVLARVPTEGAKIDGVSIRQTPKIGGFGAFADRRFEPEEVVGEYTGEIFFNQRRLLPHQQAGDAELVVNFSSPESAEAMNYPPERSAHYAMLFSKEHPFFMLNDKFKGQRKAPLLIDAETHRNEMAFANHSARFPNMVNVGSLKIVCLANNSVKAIEIAQLLIAKHDIDVGEELLFTYNESDAFKKSGTFKDLNPKPVCYTCGQKASPEKELLNCCRCKVAKYCNKTCQSKDWKKHKDFCPKSVGQN
jgi:hypothetical protein